jgi:hypothetical protein
LAIRGRPFLSLSTPVCRVRLAYDGGVRSVKRILLAAAALLASLVYVWVAAVRAAPRIAERKRAARAARRAR